MKMFANRTKIVWCWKRAWNYGLRIDLSSCEMECPKHCSTRTSWLFSLSL